MKVVSALAFVGLITLTLPGCGDSTAQKLAADEAALTAAYEKQVDNKVTAETAFYATQRENLIESLVGYRSDTPGSFSTSPNVRDSIYFGMIMVNAERDARVSAEDIVASNGQKVMGPTLQYIETGVKEEQGSYAELSQKQAELGVKLSEGLKTLNEQKSELETVRSKVVMLSQPLSSRDQVQQLIDLGKATQKILQSEKK
jgi:hypothetical protein